MRGRNSRRRPSQPQRPRQPQRPPAQNVIQRHAQLACAIQHFRANGQQPPQHLIHEVQRIESKASATLAAPELNQAMRASQALQAQMFQNRDIQEAQRQAKDKVFFTDRAMKQGTGFDAGQLRQIKRTGKVTERPSFHPGRAKGRVTQIAKQFDRNMTLKQWEDIAERVSDMKEHGKDPSAFLRGKFGNRAGAAADALTAFTDSGIEFAYKLSKGEDVTRELTRDERSELDMKLTSAVQDSHAFDEPIHEDYLNRPEGDITGDISRAMEKVEFEQMAEERENYV